MRLRGFLIMTQCDMILAHLREEGEITPVEALREYSCFRLAARIADLKQDGHTIKTFWVDDVNRFGEKIRYARYRLK